MTNIQKVTEEVITAKELAMELNLTAKSFRKWLRDKGIEKPSTRWEWPISHPAIAQIRELRNNLEVSQVEEVNEPQEELETIQEIFTKGNWKVLLDTQASAVQALYQGPNSEDRTPWITEETQIRKTLPKYIQAEIKRVLQ